MTFSRETITLDQLLQSADVISSQGFYDAREVNLILEDKLPQNTSLIPAEISRPEFAQVLAESLNVFAKPAEELAALEIPNRPQLVLPIILKNGHITGLHATKDKNNKIQVTYFDPIGIDTPHGKPEPFSQDKYLEYSSIPTHVIEAIEQGLKVSRDDIAITTDRIQGTFFKDEQRQTYAADSGPLTTYFLNEIAHGNIKVSVTPQSKMAVLTKKTADGNFAYIDNYDPKAAEDFTKTRRRNDLGKLKDIFEEKLQESGKKISVNEAKRFEIFDPYKGNAIDRVLKQGRKKTRGDDSLTPKVKKSFNAANVVTRALFATAALLNLPELKNSNTIAKHNNLRALSTNDREVEDLPRPDPSSFSTSAPSIYSTSQPTLQPTAPTIQPTSRPTSQPSEQPSEQPSKQPSEQPSEQPSSKPSEQPSSKPSEQPSSQSNLLTTTSNPKTVSRQVIAAIAGGSLGAIGETLLQTTGDGGGGVASFLNLLYEIDENQPRKALSIKNTVKYAVIPAAALVGIGGFLGYFINRNPHAEKVEDKDSSKTTFFGDEYQGTHSSIKFSNPVKNGETFFEEGFVDPAIGVTAFWAGVAAIATAAVCIKSCQGKSEREATRSNYEAYASTTVSTRTM